MSGDRTLIQFGTGDEVTVQASEEGLRFLLISGAPIDAPVAWHGPLVMNSQDELRQAMRDLRNNTFIKSAH
jgi:redox-sensitive bicupin YhaK (pirin superfamily)